MKHDAATEVWDPLRREMPPPGCLVPLHPGGRQSDQGPVGKGARDGGGILLLRRKCFEAVPFLPLGLPPGRLPTFGLEGLRGVPNVGHCAGLRQLHIVVPGHSGTHVGRMNPKKLQTYNKIVQ